MKELKSNEIRREVVRIAKKAEESGLCQYKSGNFSIIDRERGLVYITPSGISREELTSDMIAVVDIDGNIVEAPYKPSIEVSMHINTYKIKQEATGVAHSHSRYATLFACMGKELLPVAIEAVHYGGVPIRVADYAAPGSKELAKSIVEPLKESEVCLLKYHGVLASGQTLEKALLNLIYVEEVAFLYYHLLTLGKKEFLPQEIFDSLKNA